MATILKLLPACGFVIAAALVCVTSAFKDAPKTHNGQTLYRFKYTPPSTDPNHPYSVDNVEDVGNWSYDAAGTTCPTGSVEACTIMASQVDNSGDEPVLLNAENVVASIGSVSGVAYVSSTTDDVSGSDPSNITNRRN